MAAAALTEYQGHQEYEECLARMAGKVEVQVSAALLSWSIILIIEPLYNDHTGDRVHCALFVINDGSTVISQVVMVSLPKTFRCIEVFY